MDILTAMDVAKELGGIGNGNAFDEIGLTSAHVQRLKDATPGGVEPAAEFCGVKIFASEVVPNGYGILRNQGKVVGVANFMDGSFLWISSEPNQGVKSANAALTEVKPKEARP